MTTTDTTSSHEHDQELVEFTVDGEPFTTRARELTPEAILELAGLDPATHYLVLVHGRDQMRLEAGEPVRMHEHLVFVSASTEPTPVS